MNFSDSDTVAVVEETLRDSFSQPGSVQAVAGAATCAIAVPVAAVVAIAIAIADAICCRYLLSLFAVAGHRQRLSFTPLRQFSNEELAGLRLASSSDSDEFRNLYAVFGDDTLRHITPICAQLRCDDLVVFMRALRRVVENSNAFFSSSEKVCAVGIVPQYARRPHHACVTSVQVYCSFLAGSSRSLMDVSNVA
jgi:hypothetical protein